MRLILEIQMQFSDSIFPADFHVFCNMLWASSISFSSALSPPCSLLSVNTHTYLPSSSHTQTHRVTHRPSCVSSCSTDWDDTQCRGLWPSWWLRSATGTDFWFSVDPPRLSGAARCFPCGNRKAQGQLVKGGGLGRGIGWGGVNGF